jgi:hypothetical protein
MPTDQHSETVETMQKVTVVAFRCPADLKKQLRMKALAEDTSSEAILVAMLEREFGRGLAV